jgi:quinol monooxygenase YgiN
VILIVVKFQVRPDRRRDWFELMDEFTEATRLEPGNIAFEVFGNSETPNQFVLIEEFESALAGESHVKSEHFKSAMARIPEVISETPRIVHLDLPGEVWSELVELATSPSR